MRRLAEDLGVDGAIVVSEVYSPQRETGAAGRLKNLGIAPGVAMDLATTDENGMPWDFHKLERRQAARAKLQKERPMLLVGSPMCTRFCTWQALSDARRDPEQVRREHARAMVHLEFVAE